MTSRVHVVDQFTDAKQIEKVDLFVAFDAGDERSWRVCQAVAMKATHRWMIRSGGTDTNRAARIQRKLGIDVRPWPADTEVTWSEWVAGCGSATKLRVFIDVSSIPRTKLAVLMHVLRVDAGRRDEGVELILGYCLASYAPPARGDVPPNGRVEPVHPEFAGWPRSPGLPVALTVGLGYEHGKALGAVEYIQPSSIRVFIPHSPEIRYLADVREINQDLIADDESINCFNYDVLDPASQLGMLRSLLEGLASTHKLVVLPFGPKIFFAITLLAAMDMPDVAVWHVSGEEKQAPPARRPSGHSIFLRVTLR